MIMNVKDLVTGGSILIQKGKIRHKFERQFRNFESTDKQLVISTGKALSIYVRSSSVELRDPYKSDDG